MREVGRRGAISVMYEFIISLVFLGLFAGFTFMFIENNVDGGHFWSKVYASDLATSAELALAPQGNVLVRYDNIKPKVELGFWLDNGIVAIAPLPEEKRSFSSSFAQLLRSGTSTRTIDYSQPPDAAVKRYGEARVYPRPGFLENPTFLALRKVEESFSILPADLADSTCPSVSPPIAKDNARIHLEVEGAYSSGEKERLRQALREVIAGTSVSLVDGEGTVPVTITIVSGEQMNMVLTPQGAAGAALACHFSDGLLLLSLGTVQAETPKSEGPGFGFAATITISNEDYLTPEMIGKSIGLGIAEAYK